MSQNIAVKTEDLSLAYQGSAVLSNVDFQLNQGESLALLGPNGGGKTTLILGLLGLLKKTYGNYTLGGTSSYIAQGSSINEDYPATVLDVVLMGAYRRLRWYQRLSSVRDEALKLLDTVGMGGSGQQDFHTLSGGQKQRAMIARALMEHSEILLLDEPFSGIDAKSTEEIFELLNGLCSEGKTLIISTHDTAQAKRCSKVLCLNTRQLAFGDPADTLTPKVLQDTYGSEIFTLEDGTTAVTVGHHHH